MTRPVAEPAEVEETLQVDPLCVVCREPVDLSRPYVRIAITVQTQRRGTTYTHARNVLGTWHKRCARSWPVPLQRNAPTEETNP